MKSLINKEVEKKFINNIVDYVSDKQMTISNVKDAMKKVYKYMENNSKL